MQAGATWKLTRIPLELLTAKVRETVADTQNLANEIAAKVEESATVLTAWVPISAKFNG